MGLEKTLTKIAKWSFIGAILLILLSVLIIPYFGAVLKLIAEFAFYTIVFSFQPAYSMEDCSYVSQTPYDDSKFRNISASDMIFHKPSSDYEWIYLRGRPKMVAKGHAILSFDANASMEQKIKVDKWLVLRNAQLVGFISGMETYQYKLSDGDDLGLVIYCLENMDGVWLATSNSFLIIPEANTNNDLAILASLALTSVLLLLSILGGASLGLIKLIKHSKNRVDAHETSKNKTSDEE